MSKHRGMRSANSRTEFSAPVSQGRTPPTSRSTNPRRNEAAVPLHNPYALTKLIPFPTRRNREVAAYALALSARYARLNNAKLPPLHPENLGNMLQVLVTKRPAVVIAIGHIVAEMLAQIDREALSAIGPT